MPGSNSPDFAATQLLADVAQQPARHLCMPWCRKGRRSTPVFSLSTLPEASLGYAVAVYPQGGNGDDLVNEIKKILADDVKNGLPADLIEAEGGMRSSTPNSKGIRFPDLAMEWSEAVAVEGRNRPTRISRPLPRPPCADVDRVARQYLEFDRPLPRFLTPQPSGKPISSSAFGGQESLASNADTRVELPDWAAKALSRLSVPESSLHPVVTTLPNGLKLIVQPESVSNTVSVWGQIKNNPNVEAPPGKEGVGSLLDQLFEYGTTTLDRLAFQKALDDIGAEESAGTAFSVQVLPAQFDRAVQLLAENELTPALPEDAFKIVQRRLAGRWRASSRVLIS